MAFNGKDPFGGVLSTESAELPSSAGTFTPGFIGLLHFRHEYELFSTVDLSSDYYMEEGLPKPVTRLEFRADSYRFTYDTSDKAALAAKAIERTFTPHIVHAWSLIDEILWRTPEAAENWKKNSDVIEGNARVISLGGNNWFPAVGWNFLTLPSIVEAAARFQAKHGYIPYDMPEEPILDFTDVRNHLRTERERMKAVEYDFAQIVPVITDEVQFSLCGSKKDYVNSALWRQRAELWASLGEQDPKRYQAQKAEHAKAGAELSEYETASELLLACSRVATQTAWTQPMWCRFEILGIPTVDAMIQSKGSGNWRRQEVPILLEIYGPGDAGHALALETFEATGSTEGGNGSTPTDVPPGWAQVVDDWYENVAQLRKEYKSVKAIPDSEITLLDCTREQIEAAWENPAVTAAL